MATTRLLLKEICAAVREALADYPFPAPDGSWSDVRVFLHGLPQEQSDACYPFVIEHIADGSLKTEGVVSRTFPIEEWEKAFEYAGGKYGDGRPPRGGPALPHNPNPISFVRDRRRQPASRPASPAP